MAADFLHGIETIEINDGARPIRRARMSVIGLIGTAPAADGALWPYNTPVAVYGNHRALAGLGATGTLPQAFEGIFSQIGALVVVVRVPEGQTVRETMSALMGSPAQRTGVYAFLSSRAVVDLVPRILIAPSFSAVRPTDGVASIQVTNAGAGYIDGATVAITGDGEGATAEAVVVNGQVQAINVTNPGLGYTNATAQITAINGGAGATATVTKGTTRNPLVSRLQDVANRLRAIVVPDLPNTTTADAISYRHDWGSARIYGADPWPRVWNADSSALLSVPASPYVAGAIARSDNERGVHWSPSSLEIFGVEGLCRPIDHSLFDPSAESQILNGSEVSTFAREDGFRLFGNRTFSTDPLWAFLSVRRTADLIHESVEKGVAWALDRPFSMANVREVAESATDFLRSLRTDGATLGGKVWFDPAFNTKDKIRAGNWTYDFDMEPPPPAERITFRVHRNGDYIDEVVAAASRQIAAL